MKLAFNLALKHAIAMKETSIVFEIIDFSRDLCVSLTLNEASMQQLIKGQSYQIIEDLLNSRASLAMASSGKSAHSMAVRALYEKRAPTEFDNEKFIVLSDFVQYIFDHPEVFVGNQWPKKDALKNYVIQFLLNMQDSINFDETVEVLIKNELHNALMD